VTAMNDQHSFDEEIEPPRMLLCSPFSMEITM
jgi:hypothetical protein